MCCYGKEIKIFRKIYFWSEGDAKLTHLKKAKGTRHEALGRGRRIG